MRFSGCSCRSKRQRADGLHDVVFHPVAGQRRNESPDRPRPESRSVAPDCFARHLVEPAGKQFGQPQSGLTAINPSVKAVQRSSGIGPALLRRPPRLPRSRLPLPPAATAAGSSCDSRARIRRRATSGWSSTRNSVPKIGLMPARFAACANSTAPCKLPMSVRAMAGQAVLLGAVDDGRGRKRRIEKRVVTADAQRNVGRRLVAGALPARLDAGH